MLHKAKHYDNENQKYTFDTDTMIAKVQEYNDYIDAFIKIDEYLNQNSNQNDTRFYKKKAPFYLVIDDVALAVSRQKSYDNEHNTHNGFTPALASSIVNGFNKYENFFNETNEKLSELRRDGNKEVWKAAIRLFERIEGMGNIDKSKLKDNSDLKKLLELQTFADELKQGFKKTPISYQYAINQSDVNVDAIKISKLIKNIKDVFTVLEQEEIREHKESALKNLKAEVAMNGQYKKTIESKEKQIEKLEKQIADLQKQVEQFSIVIDSPHKLAAKDLKNKFNKSIDALKKVGNKKPKLMPEIGKQH